MCRQKSCTVNPLIVALDVPDIAPAIELARTLAPYVGAFKVGLELFNAVGPTVFSAIRNAAGSDVRIFYDAKFHDIPNTVAGAVSATLVHSVWMTNIHASGGSAMMKAAVNAAARAGDARPLVIAVTVLTSIDDAVLSGELGIHRTAADQVVALARLAQDVGCDGVVASPRETKAIRSACGPDFVIVTPGVRPAGTDIGDQKRVMTPVEAISQGANYLVIGRPIAGAPSPVEAAIAIGRELGC